MTFEEYAQRVIRTAEYPLVGLNMVYPAPKLAGEAGELADKIGKHWRNSYNPASIHSREEAALAGMDARSLTSEQKLEIVKELGDVLWYVNALAVELGVSLQVVAVQNVVKVEDRRTRGVIKSEGDNR